MQAVHFCFAFGGILSPLLSEPFMAKKECITVDTRNETGKQTFQGHLKFAAEDRFQFCCCFNPLLHRLYLDHDIIFYF